MRSVGFERSQLPLCTLRRPPPVVAACRVLARLRASLRKGGETYIAASGVRHQEKSCIPPELAAACAAAFRCLFLLWQPARAEVALANHALAVAGHQQRAAAGQRRHAFPAAVVLAAAVRRRSLLLLVLLPCLLLLRRLGSTRLAATCTRLASAARFDCTVLHLFVF